MRRAAIERGWTVSRWEDHLAVIHEGDPGSCVCERQPGRFRKGQRVFPGGGSRRHAWNWSKYGKFVHPREQVGRLAEKEGRAELDECRAPVRPAGTWSVVAVTTLERGIGWIEWLGLPGGPRDATGQRAIVAARVRFVGLDDVWRLRLRGR